MPKPKDAKQQACAPSSLILACYFTLVRQALCFRRCPMLTKKLEELLDGETPNEKSVSEHLKSVGVVDFSKEEISRSSLISVLKAISSDGAPLNKPQIIRILEGFGFAGELSKAEDVEFEEIWDSQMKPKRRLRSVVEAKKDINVEKLEKELSILSSKLENISSAEIPSINDLKKSIEGIKEQSRRFAAPIKIPAPKDMEVQLVSADSLHRLSEHNSDINVFLTLASVFLGAFLGMLGNSIFSASTSGQAYGVIAILALVSVVFFVLYKRAEDRRKSVAKSLFDSEQGVYLDDYKA